MMEKSKAEIKHAERGDDESIRQLHFDSSAGFDKETEDRLTKSILRKLDTRMLPMLGVLFLFSFLDRTNIGNAKILGLQEDLDINAHQYSCCLAIFFAFYIASEVPSNLIIKKVSPRIWLGVLTIVWGVIGMAMGFVQNYTGLLVVRAFLGAAEGGLLPGIVLYLSMMYRRQEIGIRLGIIYSAASLSGAFGGLLATGLYQIGSRGGQAGWRWILIIEGIATALIGVLAIVILPATVDKARFLNQDERKLAVARLLADRPLAVDDNGDTVILTETFSWHRVNQAICSMKTWLSAIAYLAILSALYSFGLFVPSIIRGLGYSAVRAQLYSVPPYAVAAFLTVVAAFVSDKHKIRGPVILVFLPLSIIGYAVIGHTDNLHLKYGMLFMMASGLYPSVPPILVWLSNNYVNHWTRATAIGLQLAIANCGGFIAAFVYPSHEAPAYKTSHTVVMGLLCAAWVLVALKCAYLSHINRRKAAGAYDKYIGCGDDKDPVFRYMR